MHPRRTRVHAQKVLAIGYAVRVGVPPVQGRDVNRENIAHVLGQ